jgi:hypothetical protein
MLPDRHPGGATPPAAFRVGPYSCTPLAEPSPARVHVPSAVVRRQMAEGTRETRLVFEEENFETAEEALAYAAARADFLLRFEASKVLPF